MISAPRTGDPGRTPYLLAAVVTIGGGLLVHRRGGVLGATAHDVLGDVLWGMMLAWWTGAFAPQVRLPLRTLLAYGVCVSVELSQLLHTPWLDAARASPLGHLVLGSDFDPRDLGAYAVGVLAAMLIEQEVARRFTRRRETQHSF